MTVRDEDAWFKSIKKMNVKFQGENGWMAYLSTTANKFKFLGNTLYTMMLVSNARAWVFGRYMGCGGEGCVHRKVITPTISWRAR